MSGSCIKRLQEWNRQTNRTIDNLYKEVQIYEENSSIELDSEKFLLLEKMNNKFKVDSNSVSLTTMEQKIGETQAALEAGKFFEKLLK